MPTDRDATIARTKAGGRTKKGGASARTRRPAPPAIARGVATIALIAFTLAGCGDDDATGPNPYPKSLDDIVVSETVTPNPSGYAPLTARLDLETTEPVSLEMRVVGRNGPDSDVIRRIQGIAEIHKVPVLGLYPDHENVVELAVSDAQGVEIGTRTYTVQTSAAAAYLPEIVIDEAQPSAMAEGMTLVSYFGHAGDPFPTRPFIFDRFGDVRWVLDYSSHPQLAELSFDDGIERLANGNFYFGDKSTNRIYEVDMLGEVQNSWQLQGHGFHHEVSEMPNGNFLVTTNLVGASTVEDHVIEIDRASGMITNVWDLRVSLDEFRRAWSDDEEDWVHLNAVTYDEEDDAIIVSGRHQGLIELTRDNEVAWILAPHRDWGTAGDGTDLSTRLLQPLDAAGMAIADTAVLAGTANHPDFEWNWYQHAPAVLPDGNILLFDNGDNRNYVGTGPYSRAVEYEIDEEAMTVRQVWTYGKERGEETYSRIVSDVDYRPEEDHVFFSPGAVNVGDPHGKVIEIDRASGAVVFEATITPPEPRFIIAFHRTERLSLYP